MSSRVALSRFHYGVVLECWLAIKVLLCIQNVDFYTLCVFSFVVKYFFTHNILQYHIKKDDSHLMNINIFMK